MPKEQATTLQQRAAQLFPFSPYLNPGVVRANRRKWIAAVRDLRNRPEGSHWAFDHLPKA